MHTQMKESRKFVKNLMFQCLIMDNEDNLLTEKDKQKLFSENKESNNYFKF